ncbi:MULTISPECIES: isochorismatase family protein [Lactobacillus]|uniref:isochorismatase family protein n=1 Tax=Lactobacillus TaxID=1578 RepID=UPI0018DBEB00|nr:isochorismatase family protein [Lactobacillus sp. W8172]MBI0022470.1 isochorismatase family protein [Lactobacillus sp. W8172]
MSADNLLLVVDVQEQAMDFSSKKKKLLERINRVIKKFEENNDPVIYVKQENLGDFSSKLKVESSAPVFTKNEPSPFTQTNFAQKVHDLNPKNVVVEG